jgi:hypothetical protein
VSSKPGAGQISWVSINGWPFLPSGQLSPDRGERLNGIIVFFGSRRSQGSGGLSTGTLVPLKEGTTIRKPDEWHLHIRDGDMMWAVLAHTVKKFGWHGKSPT